MYEQHNQFIERHFFTPSEHEKISGVWPVRLGRNRAKPNYYIGPKVSSLCSLHFVLKGKGMFVQDEIHYPIAEQDLFCLFPKKSSVYYTDPDHPLEMIWVAFDGKHTIRTLYRAGIKPNEPHTKSALTPEVKATLQEWFQLAEGGERLSADYFRLALTFKLFGHLTVNSHENTPEHRTEASTDWLAMAQDYLKSHYMEGVSVDKAAQFVGIDRSHFSKKFRQTYGLSPIQYIQGLKMEQARQMMAENTYSLTEIALSVGYPDLFSFSKAFKRHYTVTPTAYAIQLNNKDALTSE
ncbi:AraC family transcriptional regulator [Paenibacillus swuensis]|uniref:AraC family transcriptional regulator n=1 Tax=Paenibacillus swuensis TaxID=1178515 RepID=UPI000A72CCC0|nr:AraC family transcriptional regulator [Paenibacillus swuensis]